MCFGDVAIFCEFRARKRDLDNYKHAKHVVTTFVFY